MNPGHRPFARRLILAAAVLCTLGAAPARAATPRVLALGPTLANGDQSYEVRDAQKLGYDVDVVDAAGWLALGQADFAKYRALIIGDTGGTPNSAYDAAAQTVGLWGPAVSGNVVIVGTDPIDHYGNGGAALVENGIRYATDNASKTGAFISLSDTYDGSAPGTPVPLLDAFGPGSFTVRGAQCYESAHIVVDHPALTSLTDAQLSNWGCSVHETFDNYPQGFIPLAIARDNGSDYTAPDGTQGTPYILARGGTTSLIGRNVVALGDSVSAGEGIGYHWSWKNGQWNQPQGVADHWETYPVEEDCHQSAESHPRLLEELLSAKVTPLSCTGSTAYNGVLDNRTESTLGFTSKVSDRQLGSDSIPRAAGPNPAYDAAKADVVTLSLGANDVDFEGKVSACYTTAGLSLACDTGKAKADLGTDITAMQGNLRKVLDEILVRGSKAGKIPVVALTEYIDPFPLSYPNRSHCLDVNPANRVGGTAGTSLTSGEFDYLRLGLRKLNKALRDVAGDYENVVSVPAPELDDHRFCSQDPWVFGPSIKYFNLARTNKAPFHPTVEGQRALAQNLVPYIRDRYSVRAGDGVPIQFPSGGIRVTYSHVTTPGSLAVVPVPVNAVPPATTFNPQQTFTITSSAVTTGPTTLQLQGTPQQQLYHYTGGSWQTVPTTWSGGKLTGQVTSFSPFALGEPAAKVTAALTAPSTARSRTSVTLDAVASAVERPGSVERYDWAFGDGTTVTTTASSVLHAWESAGTYEVQVTVRSTDGSRDTATKTVSISNDPPVVAIEPFAASLGAATALRADASDPEGAPVDVTWSFGDGSDEAYGASVSHTWSQAGSFEVRATAADDQGQMVTAAQVVSVTDPAVAPQLSVPFAQPVAPITGSPVAVPPLATPPTTSPRPAAPDYAVLSITAKKRTISVTAICRTAAPCRFRLTVTAKGRVVATAEVKVNGKTQRVLRLPATKTVKRSVKLAAIVGPTKLKGKPKYSKGIAIPRGTKSRDGKR